MAGGITIGFIVFMITGSFLNQYVLHSDKGCFFPAVVAGIWAAWPLIHSSRVARYNFLHPVPREYKVPAKQVFSKIRQFLSEKYYNYGDKWYVATADPNTGSIVADLRFTDEEIRHEMDSRGQFHTRKERFQRHINLKVHVADTGRDTALVTLDYSLTIEGFQVHACDSIVTGLTDYLETNLGPGVQVGNPNETRLPAPPWWLLSLSALALLALLGDVNKAIFR